MTDQHPVRNTRIDGGKLKGLSVDSKKVTGNDLIANMPSGHRDELIAKKEELEEIERGFAAGWGRTDK